MIEAPIGRDRTNPLRHSLDTANPRDAVTHFEVAELLPEHALLRVRLETGRTHQIRVHLAAIGNPVAGDPLYGTGTSRRGPDGLERLFLHAWRLEFTSPSTGRLIRAEAEPPLELESVLDSMRSASDGRHRDGRDPNRG